jgi:DNA-directed RNA polymerase specialized sigma24 family protein
MIEDLLYRIQSTTNVDMARAAIEQLPLEYGLVLDLFYEGELTQTDIARLLDWSARTVSQRLTRGTSLLKYALHPERFLLAEGILSRPPKDWAEKEGAGYENTK